MAWISDPEDEDSHPQASSSKMKIVNGQSHLPNTRDDGSLIVRLVDNDNPLADFEFNKLPTELLVAIFHHARASSVHDAYEETYTYPVALSHVCRYWRTVALSAPTLWTNIRILEHHTERSRETARIYLERSKACPLFLTWFTESEQLHTDVPGVIKDLIIPEAERWQRITLIAGNKLIPDTLFTAMEPLDFPILQDIEVSCVPFMQPPSPKHTLCRSAPLLRRCRFRDVPSLPPLPSNLVVLDCVFSAFEESAEFDLDPLLEFLPHVAHSLEHLRFGLSPTSEVKFTAHTPRIPLENLKSLLITDSHVIMNHILAPNLTHFVALHPPELDAREAVRMFDSFSAPKLQSIRLHNTPLLPFLTKHSLPSMFPQLESISLSDCADESAFVPLLEPPKPKKPSSLKKASKYPPKHRKVENPFPHLKELAISDMAIWTSLQGAIEKRLKNGDKSLRKIRLPKGDVTEVMMPHLLRWFPAQGVELDPYELGKLPRSTPEFQDEFCDEENSLFFKISIEGSDWDDDDDDDDDDEYWEERVMMHPDYELPSHLDPHHQWNGFYDPYDDEEEEYEEEDFW